MIEWLGVLLIVRLRETLLQVTDSIVDLSVDSLGFMSGGVFRSCRLFPTRLCGGDSYTGCSKLRTQYYGWGTRNVFVEGILFKRSIWEASSEVSGVICKQGKGCGLTWVVGSGGPKCGGSILRGRRARSFRSAV